MTSIKLRSDHKRYFTNPCEHDAEELAKFCTDEWLENALCELATRLIDHQIPPNECEISGVYTGCGGSGFALLKAGQALPKNLTTYVQVCNQLLNLQAKHNQRASSARQSSYLTGNLGLRVTQAISDHMAGKSIQSFEEHLAKLVEVVCTEGYQKIGDNEILNGRAGFLLAIQQIRDATGSIGLPDAQVRKVLSATITSGRLYSQRNRSPAPLFYNWHNKEYLGAAHGLSGILQALLIFWDLLTEDERADVKITLNWYVGIQSPNGNYASSTRHIDIPKGEDDLVHWCHGAPGVVHLLISALILFQDIRYLEAAKKCVDLIWHRGILRKGPGLCHGVAGNGYAFLLLYRVVNDPELIRRAKAFAVVLMSPEFNNLADTPDHPYSLFEGLAGALTYLIDLRNPMQAQFPFLPIKFTT